MHVCEEAPPPLLSFNALESPVLSVLSASWRFGLGAKVLPTEVHLSIIHFLSAVELSKWSIWLPTVEWLGIWLRGNNAQI